MPPLPPLALIALLILATSSGASAQELSGSATYAPAQHYVITLPDAPVTEVAEVVLGETLGLPFKVDADVDAVMTFKVDGLYSPKELAREFGYRLWNVDVVLIERKADGLWLIPEAELPAAVAAGAVVVSPLATGDAAASTRPVVSSGSVVGSATPPKRDGFWVLALLAGWLGGVASAVGWRWFSSRAVRHAPVLLPAPPTMETENTPADDLTIPSFESTGPSVVATLSRNDS